MAEFFAFLLGAIADYWGQAGQRRTWWLLGGALLVIIVVWQVAASRAA